MSRPHRPTSEILQNEDWDKIEEAGPHGIYLDGIILCLGDKCAAWEPACKRGSEDEYCAARDSGDGSVPCTRGEICRGFCKLIERRS